MKIYIVSKVVDELDNPSTTAMSAHIDESRANDAAKAIAHAKVVASLDDLKSMTYGVVEEIELDLTGASSEDAYAVRQAAGLGPV